MKTTFCKSRLHYSRWRRLFATFCKSRLHSSKLPRLELPIFGGFLPNYRDRDRSFEITETDYRAHMLATMPTVVVYFGVMCDLCVYLSLCVCLCVWCVCSGGRGSQNVVRYSVFGILYSILKKKLFLKTQTPISLAFKDLQNALKGLWIVKILANAFKMIAKAFMRACVCVWLMSWAAEREREREGTAILKPILKTS